MSDKTRRMARFMKNHSVWRVVDDRSGFVEFSNNMIIDHRGRVSLPHHADPIHPIEVPLPIIVDSPNVPFSRPDPDRGFSPKQDDYVG